MLLDGFSLGFSLHYDGPHCIRFSGNHQSALQAPSLVDDKLRHEMHLGRIAGPFQQVPFPNFQASPLGLVPKHEIGKFRLIHDLSFPKGDSINFYTSKEYTTVQYESLDIVIDLVRSYGHNSLIAKADIQDAFRLVPIRPQDYPLLGFTWNGMFYHDKVLPMCSAVSCQTFERFSRALQWILQTHFGVSKVTHLLDDFIFFGPCNESTCLTSLLSFEKLSHDIGIPLNHGKRCLPSTCQIVYGIEIDAAVMELRLPEEKLTKATSLVNRITNRRKVTLRDLLSLIGLLNFACLVVPPGRAFLRRLINLTIGVTRLNNFMTLNHEARADLAAWQEFVVSFNGKSMFLEQQFLSSTTIKLYTDASSDIGFAVVFGKKWVAGRWHRPFTSADITLLELFPLVLATKLFGKLLANHCIIFMSDNSGVVDIVNKCTSKNRAIMKLVRRLVLACLKYNVLFRCRHVPGYENVIADHLSRLQIGKARNVAPWLDCTPVAIPDALKPDVLLD